MTGAWLIGLFVVGHAADVLFFMVRHRTSDRTAHLLNSQAMNLDVVDVSTSSPFLVHPLTCSQKVIPLVPPDWPLNVMSSFLARSFRRTLHAKHEGQIVKAISAGQNLEVCFGMYRRPLGPLSFVFA
jgi:hypothetical protein